MKKTREREREKEKEEFPSTDSFPKWPQCLVGAQREPKPKARNHVFYVGGNIVSSEPSSAASKVMKRKLKSAARSRCGTQVCNPSGAVSAISHSC